MNPPRMGYVTMYNRFWMGQPLVTQYGVCCWLPFFVSYLSAKWKNT